MVTRMSGPKPSQNPTQHLSLDFNTPRPAATRNHPSAKNRDKARLLHRGQEHADFPAREHCGEARGPLDLDLRPARPVRPSEMIAKKQPQPGHRLVDRAPFVSVVLLEIMQERQHLFLPHSPTPPALLPRPAPPVTPAKRFRSTKRCSEPLRASRHLLPPPSSRPLCWCRAGLRCR